MKLYKGRVPDDPNPLMDQINRSLPFDIRLLPQDVATNRAWAGELRRLGFFTADEHADVCRVLDEIMAVHSGGGFEPLPEDEDVHTLVERILTERLGDTGAKIHTGRSRNDQVVCDLRLFCRDALAEIEAALGQTLETLCRRSEEHAATPLAGTTHLQPALPITLGHFLMSLAAALARDLGRLRDAVKRVNLCPLGAGAMAGSGFPVDRRALAEALGFDDVLPNSIDAVSDRDFCEESINVCRGIVLHLSRYAEQFIIWANPAFAYVRFSGAFSTGSSMMPQKFNPDAMELVRGKAARVLGASATLSSLVKGVPLSYAKDLQEDKEPLFDALDTTLLVLKVFNLALGSAQFFPERMKAALTADMLATDVADLLAQNGLPFRKAHEAVGQWVTELENANRSLLEVGPAELRRRFPVLETASGNPELPRLDFESSIARRTVMGGTAPDRVLDQIRQLRDDLAASNENR